VRELRERAGLSQEALGAESGLHRSYIGAIERGDINPTFRTLLKLCAGLRIGLTELAAVRERYEARLDRLGPYRPSPVARPYDR
jgi:transcriptional regulator with XRE-family HTH domain